MQKKRKILSQGNTLVESVKFFGAPFDPCYDLLSVLEKRRAVEVAESMGTRTLFNAPYDVIMDYLRDLLSLPQFQGSGRIFVESWLSPLPQLKDLSLVTLDSYATFIADGGCRDYANRVREFVEKEVSWGVPAMIGIDHSCTGGVLEALTKRYGKENVTMLFLDAHFDGIPQSIRYEAIQSIKKASDDSSLVNHMPNVISRAYCIPSRLVDNYDAGSFLYYLLKEEKFEPNNLKFIGIREYPGTERVESLGSKGLLKDPPIKKMFEIFRDLEENGTQFLTRAQIRKEGVPRALTCLEEIETPYIYVSVDVDVAAITAIHGSRFLDLAGLTENQFFEIGLVINKLLKEGRFRLAGFDMMETDVHRAGLRINGGIDRTYQIEANFIRQLLTSYSR